MNEFETIRLVVELLVTALATILGWNFKSLKSDHHDEVAARVALNKDLQDYKLHVSDNYVKHEDLGRLEAKIDRLFDKLDQKADKS